jgi:hypothetical protein
VTKALVDAMEQFNNPKFDTIKVTDNPEALVSDTGCISITKFDNNIKVTGLTPTPPTPNVKVLEDLINLKFDAVDGCPKIKTR